MTKQPGDECGGCRSDKPADRLRLVNGALVCPKCDCIGQWPNVKRGQA